MYDVYTYFIYISYVRMYVCVYIYIYDIYRSKIGEAKGYTSKLQERIMKIIQ